MAHLPSTNPICRMPMNTENTAVRTLLLVVRVSSPTMVAPAPAPKPTVTSCHASFLERGALAYYKSTP